jgi:CHAT domain-containing protein
MVPKEPDAIVTIVPHGPLFSVPFAALMSSNGKFLAEDHTLSYAPAIGVLRATQKVNDETKNEPSSLLAFGNPITKAIAFLGTLPYAEKEVNHVAELFGTNRSTVRISGQATKRAFAQLAPKSTVLHLATHGLIDEEHPMQSAVVLAPEGRDDGLLTVKDILQLPSLKAKLVVLSACQTGRGKITGDGVIGLSRSFIIAGTPAVMVSQWNVDDVMTEYQMVAFYKEFLKNMGKARALRKAQLETIAILEKGSTTTGGTNTRANPRYWAAFQMIGEPN